MGRKSQGLPEKLGLRDQPAVEVQRRPAGAATRDLVGPLRDMELNLAENVVVGE